MNKKHKHILIAVASASLLAIITYAAYRKYRRDKAIKFLLGQHYDFTYDELNTWPLETLELFVLKIKVDQPIIGPNTV